jgi:hypothetical protein
MRATLDDCRWLVSDAARPWLEICEQSDRGSGGEVRLATRLRKDLSTERVHLVLEQAELRRRAMDKFARAGEMFFTRQGLEQATDERIAALKAKRFGNSDITADLCCGIGGDTLALAAVGSVVGLDLDPIAATFAEANVRTIAGRKLSMPIVVGDAAIFPVGEVTAWHIDPDRRPQGYRTSRIELHEPPLGAIQAMIGRNTNAAIKLAPAAETPATWTPSCERQWLGSRGECRQQVAWFGSLATHAGRRSATIVDAAGGPRTVIGEAVEQLPVAEELGRMLYEPHAAILAARLTGTLCEAHGLAAVSHNVPYLTTPFEEPVTDPALQAFEVVDVLPLDRKQLRDYCRQRSIGRLEVKKRGVQIDPERLRREIISRGDAHATLLVAPLGGQVRAMVARRLRVADRE